MKRLFPPLETPAGRSPGGSDPAGPARPASIEHLEPRTLLAAAYVEPFDMNARIGVGINLGSSLEAPYEGNWSGGVVTEADVQRIADRGFDSVRIPVRWYTHLAGGNAIDPAWLNRVETVVDWVRARGMVAIVNQHHENPLFDDGTTQAEQDRFVSFWGQIADHFKDKDENVLFELLNEPHGSITQDQLNDMYDRAIDAIRAIDGNQDRNIVVGGRGYNGWWHLINEVDWARFNDDNLIGTFHRYAPTDFTHQGVHGRAGGVSYDDVVKGWDDSFKPVSDWADDGFDELAGFSQQQNIPIWMGEFGVSVFTQQADGIRYLDQVVGLAQARGFSYSLWSYRDVNFGVWDRRFDNAWDTGFLDTLDIGAYTPPGGGGSALPRLAGPRVELDAARTSGMAVDAVGFASGGNILRTTGGNGSARFAFGGTSGTYDLTLAYFDETDGAGTFRIKINDITVASLVANATNGSGGPEQASYRTHTFPEITLNAGDIVTVETVTNGGELGRVDYLDLDRVPPTHHRQLNWVERFGQPNGTRTDAGLTAWNSSAPGGTFEVRDGRFFAEGSTNGEAVWSSQVIDIADFADVAASVRLAGAGELDASGAFADYLRVFYRLNGGAEQLLTDGSWWGRIGSDGTATARQGRLNGSTLQIIVRARLTGAGEFYMFDDVTVTGSRKVQDRPLTPDLRDRTWLARPLPTLRAAILR